MGFARFLPVCLGFFLLAGPGFSNVDFPGPAKVEADEGKKLDGPSSTAAKAALPGKTEGAKTVCDREKTVSDRAGAVSGRERARVLASFGGLPLYFIENRGQVDSDEAAFYVKGKDKTLYFTPGGITVALSGKESGEARRWALKLDFAGARAVEPEGADRQGAVFSYFKGKPENWKTGIPTFRRLVYRGLWPGIDLELKGGVNRLKYEFIVRPGADPGDIRIACGGAESVSIDTEGRLNIETPLGTLSDARPEACQPRGGRKRPVPVEYRLEAACGTSEANYGFEVGSYDHSLPLVIDPVFLVYCGYIGGSQEDWLRTVAVDGAGSAYVAGDTWSDESTFPVVKGPDLSFNGSGFSGSDVFVAKIDPQGTALEYCGYIGGYYDDRAEAVAVDGSGSAYVAGWTLSDESTFPVTGGPDLTFNGGHGCDAFVAKVDPAGTALEYCGYIGGNDVDSAEAVAVDGSGGAYVAGYTYSSESTFPVTGGPDLTYNGNDDAFVAKVDPQGTGLDFCGYIGGGGEEGAYAVAVDGSGGVYVAGYTLSDESTFPVVKGPDLTYNGGYRDGFVAKVDPQGAALDYCGYIGGSDYDKVNGIAVDTSGSAYVAGSTWSDESTFPVAKGPDLTYNGGGAYGGDGFVAKVDPQGAALDYCGYIGGSSDDWVRAVAVDGSGSACVAGWTGSDESTFPVAKGPDLTFNGGLDGFVAKVDPQGAALDYCGYIGGKDDDNAKGIAVDTRGNVYVAGYTRSDESTFPVAKGPDLTFNGMNDAFVAKVQGGAPIVADIKANGSEGPLTINQGVNLEIEVSLDPGDSAGADADWWLIADSPSGWFRYSLHPQGWIPGFAVTYQGPLFGAGPMTVLNTSSLPLGTYEFYFGVDTDRNGVFDPLRAVYDSVRVTVQ